MSDRESRAQDAYEEREDERRRARRRGRIARLRYGPVDDFACPDDDDEQDDDE